MSQLDMPSGEPIDLELAFATAGPPPDVDPAGWHADQAVAYSADLRRCAFAQLALAEASDALLLARVRAAGLDDAPWRERIQNDLAAMIEDPRG